MGRIHRGRILAVLLAAGLLAGCGGRAVDGNNTENSALEKGRAENAMGESEGVDFAEETSSVTLEIYAWQDEEDNIAALAEAYMARNDKVMIHANFVPISEYPQRMMSLRNGEGQADCLFFPNAAEGSIWQNKGVLKNLEQWISGEELEQAYGIWYREEEAGCRFYMIPYRMSRWAVYYNKDLFDRRGIAYPEEGWTWEDYERIAVQLTKRTGEDKSYGSLSFEPTNIWWRIPARTEGANDPFLAEDLEAFKRAARWCYRLTYELGGQMPYTEQTGKMGNSYDANFLEGNVGMYFSGDWSVASLNKMIERDNLEIRYDIAPMPHWEGEVGWTISDAAVVSVMEDSGYPEEAWDFIRFVTGAEGAAVLAGRGIIPAYLSEDIRRLYLASESSPEHREYFFTDGEISRVPINGRHVEAMEVLKEQVAHYLLQEQDLEQTFSLISEELEELRQ